MELEGVYVGLHTDHGIDIALGSKADSVWQAEFVVLS